MRNLVKSIIYLTLVLGLARATLAQKKPSAPNAAVPAKVQAASKDAAPPPAPEADVEPAPADTTEDPVPADTALSEAEPTTGPAATQAAPKGDPPAVIAAREMLSEHFAEFAQAAVREMGLDQAAFRQAAVLLRAATMLNDSDARFWKLLVDTELHNGNEEGVLDALKGYLKIAPYDAIAQTQLIELYASRVEAGDAELKYLRGILAKEATSAEVRSHVAVMIAQRLLERGEQKAANQVLDEAVKLNPVNVAALDLKYQLIAPNGTALERATALLAVLKANPTRPVVLAEFGRLLASVGLTKEAVDWLNRALVGFARSDRVERQLHHDVLIDYAAEMYIAGQIQAARSGVEQILKGNPNDIDAAMLRLVIERSGGVDKEGYAKALGTATAALDARWVEVSRYVADEPPIPQPAAPAEGAEGAAPPAEPAAAPADAPEPAAVAEQARKSQDPQKLAAFISAASDYAWFEIYFNEQPANAGKWIAALETVLAKDNVTLKRLRGWMQLVNKQSGEARKTLAGQEEADALAALGLLRLRFGDKSKEAHKAVDDQARKLLQDYPSGLIGAILVQAFKARELKLEPHPEAGAIRAQLQKFPRGWLDLASNPGLFYSVKVEPLRVAHRFGDPMYVRVLLQNLTDRDIPIGEDGVIKPGLWFEAEAQAMRAQRVTGAAFERLTQTTVLPAKRGVAQYLRIDQGNLAILLNNNPTPRLQISGWCITNPSRQGKGFGPGPAGLQVPFAKKLTRLGFQIGNPQSLRKVFQELDEGGPDAKLRSLRLLAAYVPVLLQANAQAQKPLPPPAEGAAPPDPAAVAEREQQRQAQAQQAAAMVVEILDNMQRLTTDENTAVATWAKFEMTRVSQLGRRRELVEGLLLEKRWEARLLGLIATRNLPSLEMATDVVTKFLEAEEPESVVKAYAVEQLELLKRPRPAPATQPDAAGAPPAVEPAVTPTDILPEPAPQAPPTPETPAPK